MSRISGAARVAGIVGRPIGHSLSPLIHNAWIAAAGLDAVYAPFSPTPGRLAALFEACRGGLVAGFNVTLPFKEEALAAADTVSDRARRAGAANLILFGEDGRITAENTDGVGLMAAFAVQAPAFTPAGAVVVLLGGGGAARGATAALLEAGAAEIRVVNRTRERAEALAAALGAGVKVFEWADMAAALEGAGALVNTTSLGMQGEAPLAVGLAPLAVDAVVMDMVYRPLRTSLLTAAAAAGHPVADGLEMLIGQARPSFEALFGRSAPGEVDVRALALVELEGHT